MARLKNFSFTFCLYFYGIIVGAFKSTPPSGTANYVSPHPYFPPGYGIPFPYFLPIPSGSKVGSFGFLPTWHPTSMNQLHFNGTGMLPIAQSVNKRPVTKETTTTEVNSDMPQKKGKGCPLKCKSNATNNGLDLSPNLSEKPTTPASWTDDQIKHLLKCTPIGNLSFLIQRTLNGWKGMGP
ncbi:hypothetical protein HK096_011234, partial [Nowakowskiella sp. JEL0078]